MPWSDIRAVEIGSSPAASYAARLFAEYGADVLKIEPPGGDPLRTAGPLTPGGASAWFAVLNAGKRSLVVAPGERDRLRDALAGCDLVLDGRPMATPGTPDDDGPEIPDGAVVVRTRWFGGEGPYGNFRGSDAVCRALAGTVRHVGPAEGPPIGPPDFQVGILGGLWAFIAGAASLHGRKQGGRGARLDIACHEACLVVSEYLATESWFRGDVFRRIGLNRFWPTYPVGIYRAADGWIGVTTITPAQWRSLCELLDLPHLGQDPMLQTSIDRLPRLTEIEAELAPRLLRRTVAQWFAEGLTRRIPIVPVPEPAAVVGSPDARERGAMISVRFGSEQGLAPGSMLGLARRGPVRATVPALGEAAMASERPRAVPCPSPPPGLGDGSDGVRPLAGIRVLDFSMGWAGPLCTRTLADLGADIIKVESTRYPDWWRGVDRRPEVFRDRLYEKTPRFAALNRNKRAVTLDLTQREGVALARRLAATADLVVDNYSFGVMERLGLGPDALRRDHPRLVVMAMTAFGSRSPARELRAYGSTLEQGSGLPVFVGRPGDPPVMSHPAYGDPVGGLHAAAAALSALRHARRTGQGQFVDLAQVETMMPLAAPWFLVASLNGGEAPARAGNRHPDHVPAGIFPCAGEDGWVQVSVTEDGMWPGLCQAIGREDLARDPGLHSAAGRRRREDELEAALGAWTATRTADEAMDELQAAGVAAGALRSPHDLLRDPQLAARGALAFVERPFIGASPQMALPIRDEGGAPAAIRWPAPTLGQHNEEVLRDLLGLSDEEIARLWRDGIIGTELVPEQEPRRAPEKRSA